MLETYTMILPLMVYLALTWGALTRTLARVSSCDELPYIKSA